MLQLSDADSTCLNSARECVCCDARARECVCVVTKPKAETVRRGGLAATQPQLKKTRHSLKRFNAIPW